MNGKTNPPHFQVLAIGEKYPTWTHPFEGSFFVNNFGRTGTNYVNAKYNKSRRGIIHGLGLSGLRWEFINDLRQIWSDAAIDWSDYSARLDLISLQSSKNLYSKTKKYKH